MQEVVVFIVILASGLRSRLIAELLLPNFLLLGQWRVAGAIWTSMFLTVNWVLQLRQDERARMHTGALV